jgi:predicted nucleic acid-binding protein
MNCLVDTNVLVYALDGRDRKRQTRAGDWLAYLVADGRGAVSAQALTELASVCLRRMRPAWEPDEIAAHVTDLARVFEVVPVTTAVVLEAVRGVRDHRMSFFDAQMWAAARLHQVPFLLTEDMAGGATLDGVTIVDPFEVAPPT